MHTFIYDVYPASFERFSTSSALGLTVMSALTADETKEFVKTYLLGAGLGMVTYVGLLVLISVS